MTSEYKLKKQLFTEIKKIVISVEVSLFKSSMQTFVLLVPDKLFISLKLYRNNQLPLKFGTIITKQDG